MPTGMPYQVEKGPIFSTLDDFASGDTARLLATRAELIAGTDITQVGGIDSSNLPPLPEPVDDHIRRDWLGMRQDDSGAWQKQEPFSSDNRSTGWWQHYYGDVETIMREALIRAIDVALGLDRSTTDPEPDDCKRHWPVQFFWKCPAMWFEAWVAWRETGKGPDDGMVTVTFCTPGNGHPIYASPVRPEQEGEPDYEADPSVADSEHGLWVISQGDHDDFLEFGTVPFEPFPKGVIELPTFVLGHQGKGPAVVVAPAELDGGVLDDGRAYTSP